MNASSELIPAPKTNTRTGCLSDLGWFFSGAVLPIASLSFYRKASQRKVWIAILFFFAFTIFIAVLSTIALGVPMQGVTRDIQDAYRQGKVPEITIRNGVAEVKGAQPFILADEQTASNSVFVAVDTTGQITSIDRSRYTSGFLLTRDHLMVLSNTGEIQNIPLSDINALTGRDPIVINAQSVSNAWTVITIIFTAIVFIFLILWNSVVRLMFISLLALIMWGIGTLIRPKIGFGPFIISGLYAIVPAVYLEHLLSRSGMSFLGLQTLLLLLFWAIALVASLAQEKFFSAEIPSRLWTALVGLPMLLWFIIDEFVTIPAPYGEIILWAVALLTVLALAGLRLYFHLRELEKTAPESPAGVA